MRQVSVSSLDTVESELVQLKLKERNAFHKRYERRKIIFGNLRSGRKSSAG